MARLESGQMALSVQQRLASRRRTTKRRIEILTALLNGDDAYKSSLIHFKTFAALCEWSCSEMGIEKISAKTLRVHIQYLYTGGYEKFLDDIKIVNNVIVTKKVSGPTSSREVRADGVLEMIQRYSDLIEKMQILAKDNESVRCKLSEHFRKFGDIPAENSAKVIFASFNNLIK